jgi:hypothetical protein
VGKAEIFWAVDPDVTVRILTGAELAEHAINLVQDAVANDEELYNRFDTEKDRLRYALPATYRAPDDWRLEVPESVHGEEEQTTELEITFTAQSPGMGYFAFVLSDLQSLEDDEVSSIFALEVGEEEGGFVASLITDFDEMPLRLRDLA